jgi:hypothetical protein
MSSSIEQDLKCIDRMNSIKKIHDKAQRTWRKLHNAIDEKHHYLARHKGVTIEDVAVLDEIIFRATNGLLWTKKMTFRAINLC